MRSRDLLKVPVTLNESFVHSEDDPALLGNSNTKEGQVDSEAASEAQVKLCLTGHTEEHVTSCDADKRDEKDSTDDTDSIRTSSCKIQENKLDVLKESEQEHDKFREETTSD